MSKWTERAAKRQEKYAADVAAEAAEAKRRREEPTSQERMLDEIESIERQCGGFEKNELIAKLARVVRYHISGEEYYP